MQNDLDIILVHYINNYSIMNKKWVCYMIASLDSNDTYIGSSNDQPKRLYNHNRSGKYGAKRTRGQTWIPIVVISGFSSKNSCLSFEAGWKRLAKSRSNKKLCFINMMSNNSLKYDIKDPRFNRILDLLYFVHNFTFMENKFKINHSMKHDVCIPGTLRLNIFLEEWIKQLPWPFFIKPYDFNAETKKN
jgi:predicted GIY-YIG superfamily endonuclease